MRYLHALALVLFGAALFFYIASSTMSSLVLGGIGFFVEVSAWVTTWAGRSAQAANLHTPQTTPKQYKYRQPSERGDQA